MKFLVTLVAGFYFKVAKKVDEQWEKIMDGVENQPSSSSSRQGRKTPLASNTQSLNVKKNNKAKSDSKHSTSSSTVSSKASNERKPSATDNKRVNNEFSSSSEKVVKNAAVPRSARIHTAPALPTNNTDDTDNDITTDSDMAHTEDDKVVQVSSSVLTGLLAQLAAAGKQTAGQQQTEGKQRSRHSHPRPASARDYRQQSRDRDQTVSKDRQQTKDRQRSRDRLRSRERSAVRESGVDQASMLTLINQDRPEPDGRSSRQGGKSEENTSSPSKGFRSTVAPEPAATVTKPSESEGRRSGHSLDRGNNTGSSEPPTVIEVCELRHSDACLCGSVLLQTFHIAIQFVYCDYVFMVNGCVLGSRILKAAA